MHIKPARLSAQALLVLGCTLVNLHAQVVTPGAPQAPAQTQAGAPAALASVEIVEFGSLETKGLFSPQPVMIRGHLLATTGTEPGAAAVLNPACEGLLAPGGKQVRGKYMRMARFLHARGFTVLMIDGFNPRGYEEACSSNRIDHMTRLKDALGGLAYLRGRSNVAADKVVAVTWGNTGGIEGMNKGMPHAQKPDSGFMAAVMYYPECGKVGGAFSPTGPIQIFAGEKDEWNPPSLCTQLAKRQEPGSAPFLIKLYPDAYHSFDQPIGEPRPNPFNPSKGWVGRNASATADSYLAVDAFLSTLPGIPPRPERPAQP